MSEANHVGIHVVTVCSLFPPIEAPAYIDINQHGIVVENGLMGTHSAYIQFDRKDEIVLIDLRHLKALDPNNCSFCKRWEKR